MMINLPSLNCFVVSQRDIMPLPSRFSDILKNYVLKHCRVKLFSDIIVNKEINKFGSLFYNVYCASTVALNSFLIFFY